MRFMEREFLTIAKESLNELVDRLMETHQVIAPVPRNDGVVFDVISSPKEMDLEYRGHTLLPPKRFFFPEKEILFVYKVKADGVEIHDKLEELKSLRQVIIGIRPCDITGLLVLDKIFTRMFKDPYYIARRKNTLVIGLTCNEPAEYCFCVFTNSGPLLKEGFDLLLTDLGDRYLVEVGTEKGSNVVRFNPDIFSKAGERDLREREEIIREVAERIKAQKLPDFTSLYDFMRRNFNSKIWEKYGRKCLACGKCNFTCPTCHCFDVFDDPDLSLKSGKRIRVWDSCHFISFTRVASGEIFRRERTSRVKQRIYHKLCYSVDEIGIISCVGCGRCIDVCSAGIDVREVVRELEG